MGGRPIHLNISLMNCGTRYYQTWLDSSVGFKAQSIAAPSDRFHSDGTGLRSAKDKALIAFAQLACLRLNVRRGIVTLIARTQQYILAEATRTLSLLADSQHASHDQLWFGNASLPRSQGVSEHALDPAPYTALGPDGGSYTAPAFVVNDLAQDERFMHRDYAGKGVSFYAGVPITTSSGFAIGVYNVSDNRPRHGLSMEELQFMQDMASTVGSHLDKIRNESARHRGEQMVLGLGSFIEGKSTTFREPMDDVQSNYPVAADTLSSRTSDTDGLFEQFKGMAITNADPGALRRAWTSDNADKLATSYRHPDSSSKAKSSSNKDREAAAVDLEMEARGDTEEQLSGQVGLGPHSSEDPVPSMRSDTKRQIFYRAANIMRECTAADGVIFYDAMNASNARGHSKSASDHLKTSPVRQSEGSTSYSSDDVQYGEGQHSIFDRSASSDSEKQDSGTPLQKHNPTNKYCQQLGLSLDMSVESPSSEMSAASLTISEHTLRRFVRRYPRGKMFYYTEDGKASASENDRKQAKNTTGRPNQGSKPTHRVFKPRTTGRLLAEELLKVVPGARNVLFLPLWDFGKQRWGAGTFVWSRRAEKLLHGQDDLTYIKAFGNSIMSEVARLDAVTAGQAKTSFIANISHELRSPLHGILGSIEFLQDTAVDAFQSSLITSIETCGKTLLDTVNHVLDYAKINQLSRGAFGKSSKSVRNRAKNTGSDLHSSSTNSLELDFDLATVVEEVVEAVYAGQTFKPTGVLQDIDELSGPVAEPTPLRDSAAVAKKNIQRGSMKFLGAVRLSLDIERIADWRVYSQPGAIRRLVMNILGNALKYTEKGTIQVTLRARQQDSNPSSSLAFCLSFADTGRGMSADFAKNHAFTPFTQEDSFSSGTGLGLSIVRQIVDSLEGKLDLQSEQDIGTEVKIWLTLPRARSQESPDVSQVILQTTMKETPGLKMCILDSKFTEQDPLDVAPEQEITNRVEASIQTLAREWFGMSIMKSSSMSGVVADFFLYAEPPPIEYLLEHHGQSATDAEIPFIIMATNALETASLRSNGINQLTELGRILEVISQPYVLFISVGPIHRVCMALQEGSCATRVN